jgi:hypothetical protein
VTARYKLGSRVQAVWEKFEEAGADDAIAAGVSLHVSLGTLKGWVRGWSRETGAPVSSFSTRDAARPAAAAPAPRPMVTKPTVVVKFDHERVAYLIEKGPEVSRIRWGDTRDDRFYPNEVLEFGDE